MHISAQSIPDGVGLMLDCCGAPAQWAGREVLFAETRAAFAVKWRRLGQPTVVTACSSCYRMFTDHQPDVKVESLWSVLERIGLPQGALSNVKTLAIHDPCTTRHDTAIQNSVRSLLANAVWPSRNWTDRTHHMLRIRRSCFVRQSGGDQQDRG